MNNIQNMEHESYKRLREVMDHLNIEMSDADLARKFNLLDQHITNWKKRGIPKDYLIDLAEEWGFRAKYVRDGTGTMTDGFYIENEKIKKAVLLMQELPEYALDEAINSLNSVAKLTQMATSTEATAANTAEKVTGTDNK